MKDLDIFIKNDKHAEHLGIEMLEYAAGTAKARLTIKDHHFNSNGTVHGGVIFSLADSVFAVASNSRDGLAMAINISISYFSAVTGGILTATAAEISLNRKLATYLVDITDESDKKIALFQGTVYRKT